MQAGGDAQQEISDHGGEDLQPDGIFVLAKEFADAQMLLDPTEQEFDLPAAFVEGSDLDGGASQVIGDERDRPTLVAPQPNAPQRNRQPSIAFARELDLGIVDDGEAIANDRVARAPVGGAQAHVHFGAGDEESPVIVDLPPPAEVTIAFVEHVSRAADDRRAAADFDIIDIGRRNLNATRNIGVWIIDHMQLQAADASVPLRPLAQLAQRDWTGVDQLYHGDALAPTCPIGIPCQHPEQLGERLSRTSRVRVRYRCARDLPDAQMIMRLRVDVEGEFEPAQTVDTTQLRENQRHQMIPALEGLVVGVCAMSVHSSLEPAPINRFKQTSKDAIEIAHARPFLSLDNQKEPICIGSAEHAPRHSESFPGQPCAKAGPITTKFSVIAGPCHIALLRRMGPRLRGDDSGESTLHNGLRTRPTNWVPVFAVELGFTRVRPCI